MRSWERQGIQGAYVAFCLGIGTFWAVFAVDRAAATWRLWLESERGLVERNWGGQGRTRVKNAAPGSGWNSTRKNPLDMGAQKL